MRLSLRLIITAAFCALALPALAQVHKCKGPDGRIVYSDGPCAMGASGGQINVQHNTIDASMDRERTQRYIEQQQMESRRQEMQQMQRMPAPQIQASMQRRDSYACQKAIRNAGVQGSRAKPGDIDAERAKAASICGYNPWPGPTMTELASRERIERERLEAERQAEANRTQTDDWVLRKPDPRQLETCFGGQCRDDQGNSYSPTPDGTRMRSDDGRCTADATGRVDCDTR